MEQYSTPILLLLTSEFPHQTSTTPFCSPLIQGI